MDSRLSTTINALRIEIDFIDYRQVNVWMQCVISNYVNVVVQHTNMDFRSSLALTSFWFIGKTKWWPLSIIWNVNLSYGTSFICPQYSWGIFVFSRSWLSQERNWPSISDSTCYWKYFLFFWEELSTIVKVNKFIHLKAFFLLFLLMTEKRKVIWLNCCHRRLFHRSCGKFIVELRQSCPISFSGWKSELKTVGPVFLTLKIDPWR